MRKSGKRVEKVCAIMVLILMMALPGMAAEQLEGYDVSKSGKMIFPHELETVDAG